MKVRGRMARSALWAFVERAGNQFISFFVFVFVARLIGPEQYGLASLCFVAFSLANLLILGLADGIISLQIKDTLRLSTLFWFIIGVGFVLFVGVLLGADFGAALLGEPRLAPLLRWFAIAFIFLAACVVPTKRIYAALNFKLIAYRAVIASIVSGCVGLAAAFYGLGAYAIVAQQVTLQIVINIVVWRHCDWRPAFVFNLSVLEECLAPGLKMTGINIISFFEEQLPRIFIGAALGPLSLGYYAFVMRLRFALEEILVNPALSVLFPSLSVAGGERSEREKILGQVISVMNGVFFPVLALSIATAPVYVPLFFGAAWSSAVPILQIVTGASATVPTLVTVREALRAYDRAGSYISLHAAVVLIGLCVVVLLLPFGLTAASIGIVVCSWASVPVYLSLLDRWLDINLWPTLRRLAKPLIIAAFVVLVIRTFQNGPFYPSNAWEQLLSSLALGVALYSALSLVFQLREIRGLIFFVKHI